MDVSLPEKPASFQDTQNEGVSLVSSGTVHSEDAPRNRKDEKVSGPPSDHTVAEASEDRSRKEVFPQEGQQEAPGEDKELSSYGVKTEDKMKEGERSEIGQQEKSEGNIGTDLKSVQNDKEGEGKENLLGQQKKTSEGQQKEKTEKRAKGENDTCGVDVVMREECSKKEFIKGLDLEDEGKALKVKREDGMQLRIDGKDGTKLFKKEKGLKNVEKGDDSKIDRISKCDKQISENSGQPELDKKKEKKEKKSKHTAERIQAKLQKLDAKIGRILVKKNAYVLRLKEAQERECQESGNAALKNRETSTAVMAKSSAVIGLREETTVVFHGFRADHDVNTVGVTDCQAYMRPPGSLSRTASVIQVSPGHFTEEVARQKEGESVPDFSKSERVHTY